MQLSSGNGVPTTSKHGLTPIQENLAKSRYYGALKAMTDLGITLTTSVKLNIKADIISQIVTEEF